MTVFTWDKYYYQYVTLQNELSGDLETMKHFCFNYLISYLSWPQCHSLMVIHVVLTLKEQSVDFWEDIFNQRRNIFTDKLSLFSCPNEQTDLKGQHKFTLFCCVYMWRTLSRPYFPLRTAYLFTCVNHSPHLCYSLINSANLEFKSLSKTTDCPFKTWKPTHEGVSASALKSSITFWLLYYSNLSIKSLCCSVSRTNSKSWLWRVWKRRPGIHSLIHSLSKS